MALLESELLLSVDAAENRFRFFVMELHASDDGRVEVRRRWGRVGTDGCQRVEVFDSEAEARVEWERLLRRRASRGYEVAEGGELRAAERLLAWERERRRCPWQLAFSAAAGF